MVIRFGLQWSKWVSLLSGSDRHYKPVPQGDAPSPFSWRALVVVDGVHRTMVWIVRIDALCFPPLLF